MSKTFFLNSVVVVLLGVVVWFAGSLLRMWVLKNRGICYEDDELDDTRACYHFGITMLVYIGLLVILKIAGSDMHIWLRSSGSATLSLIAGRAYIHFYETRRRASV